MIVKKRSGKQFLFRTAHVLKMKNVLRNKRKLMPEKKNSTTDAAVKRRVLKI